MIPLVGPDEVIDKSKAHKINKKEKILIKESAEKNKKYHLLRWKIKRFLIQENIIKKCNNWKTILDVFDSEILNKDDLTNAEIKEIFRRCGFRLVEHHTKYEEIHGIDDTTWMVPSEHRDLHNRLRREERCDISSEELRKISIVATRRTEKHKEAIRDYNKTEKFRKYKSDYCKMYIMKIVTNSTISKNIIFHEEMAYNIKTETLTISSGFFGSHGIKLPTINID